MRHAEARTQVAASPSVGELLEADPDLESARDHPRFRELIDGILESLGEQGT